MNAPLANIFIALQERIKTSVPLIKYTDQELGQLKATRPPVSWPCVLIDFEDFRFELLSENVQNATGTIVLRLGFAPYSPSSAGTPAACTELALSYYDIEWELHRHLQGWKPLSTSGSMCRISVATQHRADNYRVREIRYTISFEDYSTRRSLTYVPAAVVVAEELHIPTSAS